MKILYHQIGDDHEQTEIEDEFFGQNRHRANAGGLMGPGGVRQKNFGAIGFDGFGDLRISEKKIVGKFSE